MFEIRFTDEADETIKILQKNALNARQTRLAKKNQKSSHQEGLYKQVMKTLQSLASNRSIKPIQTYSS